MQFNAKDVLLIDQSGRGHALCDLFVRTNPHVRVFYGPGSQLVQHERIHVVPSIDLDDVTTVVDFCSQHPVDFVFVSFIESLAAGFVDVLQSHGIPVIGPSKNAAQLEASKTFANKFCSRYNLPRGVYGVFDNEQEALTYIDSIDYKCVVKYDGLCKVSDGVTVCDSANEAKSAVKRIFSEEPKARLTIEERLYGREISIFALVDGETTLLFPTAFDYKRVLDSDRGKNCDGMGSIAPHPMEDGELREQIQRDILSPFLTGLKEENLDFTGFVYIGAMITDSGLRIIEINTRFGDSEAEAVLPSIHSDFYALCQAVLAKELSQCELAIDGFIRCSVAATQGKLLNSSQNQPGWPFGEYEVGQVIDGIHTPTEEDWQIFYAGACYNEARLPVTTSGRVLHVVGKGKVASKAIDNAYRGIATIDFPGIQYRRDIGASVAHLWQERQHDALQLDWLMILQHALHSSPSKTESTNYFLSVIRTLEILRSASLALLDGTREASQLAVLSRELIPELQSYKKNDLTEYLKQLKKLVGEYRHDTQEKEATVMMLGALKLVQPAAAQME